MRYPFSLIKHSHFYSLYAFPFLGIKMLAKENMCLWENSCSSFSVYYYEAGVFRNEKVPLWKDTYSYKSYLWYLCMTFCSQLVSSFSCLGLRHGSAHRPEIGNYILIPLGAEHPPQNAESPGVLMTSVGVKELGSPQGWGTASSTGDFKSCLFLQIFMPYQSLKVTQEKTWWQQGMTNLREDLNVNTLPWNVDIIGITWTNQEIGWQGHGIIITLQYLQGEIV